MLQAGAGRLLWQGLTARALSALGQGLACPASSAPTSLAPTSSTTTWLVSAVPAHTQAIHTTSQHGVWHSQPLQQSEPLLDPSEAIAKSPLGGPMTLYNHRKETGLYRPDPRQELTTTMLQELWDTLAYGGKSRTRKHRSLGSGLTMVDTVQGGSGVQVGSHHKHAGGKAHGVQPHKPKPSSSSGGGGFWSGVSSLLGGGDAGGGSGGRGAVAPLHAGPHLQGLYMYGGVGVGKTMLMDVFVATATPEMQVLRTHFHDFMLGVHDKLRKYKGDTDPLLRVADSIAKSSHVLALDEFFVTDVADAMILSRLFGRLWDRGVVLVATSNRHPDKLYENGLQRALFLPFIARLKAECNVHDMASTTDYRRLAHHQRGLYFTTGDKNQDLRDEWADCAEGAPAGPLSLDVRMGRTINVPLAAGKCAMMSFDDLCGRPVAAADYLALADRFHTLAVSDVPTFTGANKSSGYRFVTLIDIMYEHRVRMLFSADASPFDLFNNIITQSDAAASPALKELPDIIVDDNLGFAKDRTMSRLLEMQSLEYLVAWAKQHAPNNLLALEEAQAKAKKIAADPCTICV